MNTFREIWEIYEESFPIEERRSKENQMKLLINSKYKVLPYEEEGCLIGFMGIWDLETFLFIEHFAVRKEFRGKGFGEKMLKMFLSPGHKDVLLEVEYPKDEIARRRIEFYQRHGFVLNSYDYVQPPYEDGQNPLPLLLMSFPVSIPPEKIQGIIETIYGSVYEGLYNPLQKNGKFKE